MAGKTGLHVEAEFTEWDFNSKRLERRFIQTMERLSRQLDTSIWFCRGNRAEASETKFPQRYTGCRTAKTWIGKQSCGPPTGSRQHGAGIGTGHHKP
jgi:hypothetical protein